MTMIATWPLAGRHRIVHAFRPGGSPDAEGPFRTLRRHDWVSPGARVSIRADRGFAGQMTVFSSLNVVAARLARRGNASGAQQVARTAESLESGTEFELLRGLLSDLPAGEAEKLVDGVLPRDATEALLEALRAVASRTERLRADDIVLSSPAEVVFAGRVAEVTGGYVKLVQDEGETTMLPRWMAGAVRRDQAGAFLALVADRLAGASAVVEAVPAIEVDDPPAVGEFSPFGRGDDRTLSIKPDDARLLSGEPEPLRILVPVTIDR